MPTYAPMRQSIIRGAAAILTLSAALLAGGARPSAAQRDPSWVERYWSPLFPEIRRAYLTGAAKDLSPAAEQAAKQAAAKEYTEIAEQAAALSHAIREDAEGNFRPAGTQDQTILGANNRPGTPRLLAGIAFAEAARLAVDPDDKSGEKSRLYVQAAGWLKQGQDQKNGRYPSYSAPSFSKLIVLGDIERFRVGQFYKPNGAESIERSFQELAGLSWEAAAAGKGHAASNFKWGDEAALLARVRLLLGGTVLPDAGQVSPEQAFMTNVQTELRERIQPPHFVGAPVESADRVVVHVSSPLPFDIVTQDGTIVRPWSDIKKELEASSGFELSFNKTYDPASLRVALAAESVKALTPGLLQELPDFGVYQQKPLAIAVAAKPKPQPLVLGVSIPIADTPEATSVPSSVPIVLDGKPDKVTYRLARAETPGGTMVDVGPPQTEAPASASYNYNIVLPKDSQGSPRPGYYQLTVTAEREGAKTDTAIHTFGYHPFRETGLAFLVGIDNYVGRNAFDHMADGVDALKKRLIDGFHYPEANIITVTVRRGEPPVVAPSMFGSAWPDPDAPGAFVGKSWINKVFQKVETYAKEHDFKHVVVFFGGHGEAKDKADWFALPSTDPSQHLLSSMEWVDHFKNDGLEVIGYFDACRYGDEVASKDLNLPERFAAIRSAAPGKEAYANSDNVRLPDAGTGIYSYFTGALLAATNRASTDISVNSLFVGIRDEIKKYTLPRFERQDPDLQAKSEREKQLPAVEPRSK
ncbi:MAG TPA: caspase family protein [Chthonomonadaceae bacterium]|nr:caspase family protein [Chthonomonadaceae bacterium]